MPSAAAPVAVEEARRPRVQRLVGAALRLRHHHPERLDRVADVAQILVVVVGPRVVVGQYLAHEPKLGVHELVEDAVDHPIAQRAQLRRQRRDALGGLDDGGDARVALGRVGDQQQLAREVERDHVVAEAAHPRVRRPRRRDVAAARWVVHHDDEGAQQLDGERERRGVVLREGVLGEALGDKGRAVPRRRDVPRLGGRVHALAVAAELDDPRARLVAAVLDRKGGGALGDLQQVALHSIAVRVVVWRRGLVCE